MTSIQLFDMSAANDGLQRFHDGLAELRERYSEVYDCSTKENYEYTKKAIRELKRFRNVVKDGGLDIRRQANEFNKHVLAIEKDVVAEAQALEDQHVAAKKVVDDERERLKLEEQQRKLRIQKAVDNIRQAPSKMLGRPSDEIEELMCTLRDTELKQEDFQEFINDAESAMEEAVEVLDVMLGEAVERECVAAEQEAERQRLAAEREALEAQRREMEARLEAEREAQAREACIQNMLDNLRNAGEVSADAGVKKLVSLKDKLSRAELSKERYAGHLDEAISLRDRAMEAISQALAAAEQRAEAREAEELRLAEERKKLEAERKKLEAERKKAEAEKEEAARKERAEEQRKKREATVSVCAQKVSDWLLDKHGAELPDHIAREIASDLVAGRVPHMEFKG